MRFFIFLFSFRFSFLQRKPQDPLISLPRNEAKVTLPLFMANSFTSTRDGPLENLWGVGGGSTKKNIRAREN